MKTAKKKNFSYPVLMCGDYDVAIRNIFAEWDKQPYLYSSKPAGSTIKSRFYYTKPIDCSGFFGMAIDALTADDQFKATQYTTNLHDKGSRQQYDFLNQLKLKPTVNLDEKDGILRSFHLLKEDSESGIGHIGFVLNGYTIESCGSLGVCRREFNPDRYPFMSKCYGFVLDVPGEYEEEE